MFREYGRFSLISEFPNVTDGFPVSKSAECKQLVPLCHVAYWRKYQQNFVVKSVSLVGRPTFLLFQRFVSGWCIDAGILRWHCARNLGTGSAWSSCLRRDLSVTTSRWRRLTVLLVTTTLTDRNGFSSDLYCSVIICLTLWHPLLPYGYRTAIKHPVPDRVKPSFVFFDIRALWRSTLNIRVPGCQKLQVTA